MAHLNVAEKRIEARIAWVGSPIAPPVDLVPTNEMLGECPVHVRLVDVRATEEELCDVDGVVVVDESAVVLVRSALRERPAPVIVATDFAADETFHRVVGAVMQSITAEPTETDRRSATPQNKADGHPLLSALRRVLEATAEQQAQAMAERLEQKLDDRLKVIEMRMNGLGATGERTAALESATALLRTQLTSANEEVLKAARHACTREDLQTATADIRTEIMHAVADKLDELLVKLDVMRAAEPRIAQTVGRIDVAVRELAKGTESGAAAGIERTERVETLLKELIEELRKPKKGFFG